MIAIRCRRCQQDYMLPVDEDQIMDWKHSGRNVQDALPQLTDDERELLLSQTCGSCFDDLFPEESEEDW